MKLNGPQYLKFCMLPSSWYDCVFQLTSLLFQRDKDWWPSQRRRSMTGYESESESIKNYREFSIDVALREARNFWSSWVLVTKWGHSRVGFRVFRAYVLMWQKWMTELINTQEWFTLNIINTVPNIDNFYSWLQFSTLHTERKWFSLWWAYWIDIIGYL